MVDAIAAILERLDRIADALTAQQTPAPQSTIDPIEYDLMNSVINAVVNWELTRDMGLDYVSLNHADYDGRATNETVKAVRALELYREVEAMRRKYKETNT